MDNAVHHSNGIFYVPNPFQAITTVVSLYLRKGVRFSLNVVELIPNALYINLEPASKEGVRVRGGEVLSRNDDVAKAHGSDTSDPDERHYMTYRTIFDAIRGLRRANGRYRHQEFPELNGTLSAVNDLWMMVPDLENANGVFNSVFSAFAMEQAAVHEHARNHHKIEARETLVEVSGKGIPPANIGVPSDLRSIERSVLARGYDIGKISEQLDFRVEVMGVYLALLHNRLVQIDEACQSTLANRRIFNGSMSSESYAHKLYKMRQFASSLEPNAFPAPHRKALWHIRKDLLKAADALRENRFTDLERALEKIRRSITMLHTRRRMEETLGMLSYASWKKGELPQDTWGPLKWFAEGTAALFENGHIDESFEKPVAAEVASWLREVARLCVDPTIEPAERTDLVKEGLARACAPI